MRDYLISVDRDAKPLNEIKVILLGEGSAGKTSLMRYLKGLEYEDGLSQTHGINLEQIDHNDIKIKIWDFGGQDIMHHTHQFFLTENSIYILVLNAREQSDTEKWLKMIEVFGKKSPTIIVTNKIDENPSSGENIRFLKDKYQNLVDYHKISCKENHGLEEFKTSLIETIKKQEHIKTLWGKGWRNVKKELELMKERNEMRNYISYDKYEEICENNQVSSSHHKTLVKWLNELGVVTYFSDSNLNETNVLNPSWLTDAFYGIINDPIVAENYGEFIESDMRRILTDKKYPSQKFGYLIELMKKFELCYEIRKGRYLIPDLLSKEEPNFNFDTRNALKIKIKYMKLLPKSIFPQLMVRRHQEIKNDFKWRTGLVLSNDYCDSEALVRVDEDEKEIHIYINGSDGRGYSSGIVNDIQKLNEGFANLESDILIPCQCKECKESPKPYYYELETLEKYRKKSLDDIRCNQSLENVSVSSLLGILITKEEMERKLTEYLSKNENKIKMHLENADVNSFIKEVDSIFSSVSYLLMDKTEKAYHVPLFMVLRSLFGTKAKCDEIQSGGRSDIILELERFVYVFELKLDDSTDNAIKQIHEKGYYKPYMTTGKKIVLIGINFSSKTRNIETYKSENL